MIQFGRGESAISAAIRGGFVFERPVFGKHCVCCNQDAAGRVQEYDPSSDRVSAPAIPMPVCFDCRDHALQTQSGPIMMASLLMLGVVATALGLVYLEERPGDSLLWGMIVVGLAMTATGAGWMIRAHLRERRERAIPGHHSRLMFVVDGGRAVLTTRNETLADELLARNPHAHRLPTRAERKQIATHGDKEEQARAIVKRIVTGTPEDLEAVRAQLATGTVSHILVESGLADIEAVLGRKDLRARYRTLRGGAP